MRIIRQIVWILLGVFVAAGILLAQQTNEEFVNANAVFFERLFVALRGTPTVHQRAYFDQMGLSEAQGQVIQSVVADFLKQEDALKQQFFATAAQKSSSVGLQLTQIRSQRNQLLLQAALQVLQALGTDGANRVKSYVQKAGAAAPQVLPH